MRVVLTKFGKEKVRVYLGNLKAKRNEILDALEDTASFPPPIMSDVVADMERTLAVMDRSDYGKVFACTDHHEGGILLLRVGHDFYWDKEKMFKVRLYYEHDDTAHNHEKGDIKAEFSFDNLEVAESLYRGVFEYGCSYNPTLWKYDEEVEEYVRLRRYC